MSTKNIIVFLTAGNSGLGTCIARNLLSSSPKDGAAYSVILTSRSAEKGHEAVKEIKSDDKTGKMLNSGGELKAVKMDLDDEKSCESAVRDLEKEYGKVDVVIHNAAQHLDYPLRDGKVTEAEAFDRTLHTNVTCTNNLTSLLAPLLIKSSDPRLVFIGSGVGSLTLQHLLPDEEGGMSINQIPESKGWPKKWTPNVLTYRTSKAAQHMLASEWYKLLRRDGVKTFIIDPGWLATSLGGQDAEEAKKFGALDPMDAGNFVRKVVDGERDKDQGKLIADNGVVHPW